MYNYVKFMKLLFVDCVLSCNLLHWLCFTEEEKQACTYNVDQLLARFLDKWSINDPVRIAKLHGTTRERFRQVSGILCVT